MDNSQQLDETDNLHISRRYIWMGNIRTVVIAVRQEKDIIDIFGITTVTRIITEDRHRFGED